MIFTDMDKPNFAMPNRPRYAAMLRRELCARNVSYATLGQVPYVTSYGEVPVVAYQASPCGKKHGNFISADACKYKL
jgi:hypothetical protein